MTKTLLLLAIIVVLIYFIKHLAQSAMRLPYVKREALFTPAEKLFLDSLEQAVGSQYRIFGKVRMSDILDVKKSLSTKDYQIALNGINSKHIDFVLCDKNDASFVCGIELDDKSHSEPNRVKRDKFVNEAFAVASLPLIRFEAKSGYDIDKVRDQLLAVIGVQKPQALTAPEAPVMEKKEEGKTCPKCSGPMTRRKVNAGENAGKSFWVCNNYKTCRTSIQITCDT